MTAGTRGMLWMLGAALFFSASVGFVRYLTDSMSSFQVVLFRQILGFMCMLPWLVRSGLAATSTARLPMHTLRSALSYLGMACAYTSYTLIPISDGVALQFTTPLFTTVFAILFLRELVGPHRWAAIFIGFVGVVLIAKPGFAAFSWGIPIALAAAAFYAGSNVVNRALSRTESTPVIVFYSFFLQIPMAAIPAAMSWTTPGWDAVLPLIGFGFVAIAAQWCLTRSLAVADASLVEPVMFIRLPIVSAIGYVLFAQVPDMWVWIGAAVIFVSTWELARREAAHARRVGAARAGS